LTKYVNTDAQAISLTGNTLAISGNAGTVDLTKYVNTDAQTLALTGTKLAIAGGNEIDLASIKGEANTDAQAISLTGNSLAISGNSSTADLSKYLDNTDAQTLALTGTKLAIAGGNEIDLAALLTGITKRMDDQDLVISALTATNDSLRARIAILEDDATPVVKQPQVQISASILTAAPVPANVNTDTDVKLFIGVPFTTGSIMIFDVVGNKIFGKELISGEKMVSWDMRNSQGYKVSSGSYVAFVVITDLSGMVKSDKILVAISE